MKEEKTLKRLEVRQKGLSALCDKLKQVENKTFFEEVLLVDEVLR